MMVCGQQQRDHVAKGLGQHDQAHDLAVAHAERIAGLSLALGDTLDSRANDFRIVGRLKQREGNQRGSQPDIPHGPAKHRLYGLGHDQEKPENHHDERDGPKQVDIGRGRLGQERSREDSRATASSVPQTMPKTTAVRVISRVMTAPFAQKGERAGNGTPVEFVHRLPLLGYHEARNARAPLDPTHEEHHHDVDDQVEQGDGDERLVRLRRVIHQLLGLAGEFDEPDRGRDR